MRQCNHCQAEVPEGAQFCRNCGETLDEAVLVSTVPTPASEHSEAATDQNEDTFRLRAVRPVASEAAGSSQVPVSNPDEERTVVGPVFEEEADASEQDTLVEQHVQEEATAEIDERPTLSMPSTTPETPLLVTSIDVSHSANDEPTVLSTDTSPSAHAEQHRTNAPEASSVAASGSQAKAQQGFAWTRRTLVLVALVVLLIVAGGIGIIALVRHQATGGNANSGTPCSGSQATCPGKVSPENGAATHLTFSGAVTGTMTLSASPVCQVLTVSRLGTLTVEMTGMINGQTYNFGFVIEGYHGVGTYANATSTINILFDIPGQTTANGWSNISVTGLGTITITNGGQVGKLTYTLSGMGSQANTQVQITGRWVCG